MVPYFCYDCEDGPEQQHGLKFMIVPALGVGLGLFLKRNVLPPWIGGNIFKIII